MLRDLRIHNFAIINELEIDFSSGMSTLTGETGAGKSILLDALGMVLGDRADTGSLREGSDRAEICASFDIGSMQQAQSWLHEQALDSGEECILRRVINQDGRSKAFINGSSVTLQSMRTLAEMLVTIHGQHEHQALLKRDVQRQRLDDYGGKITLCDQTAAQFAAWHKAHERLQHLLDAEQNRSERSDLLRFQVNEFAQLNLQENEWQDLQEEHQRLAHASKLLHTANEGLTTLYDDDQSVYSVLSHQYQALLQASSLDQKLSETSDTLNNALINIDEVAGQLRSYVSELNLDPNRLEWLEERMGSIHDLSRKHHCEPDQLIAVAANLNEELSDLEHADERLSSLAGQCQQLRDGYLEKCAALTAHRQIAAKKLSEQVSKAMHTLGMAGGQFQAKVTAKPFNPQTGEGFSVNGLDQIEFLVTANPGQSLRPLAKVASGGELSRISLAIQMITAGNEPIPTLIFDEVDAGVGGNIAEIVGLHLRQLGSQRQVLCVTHLPQVAAQAHHHFRVSKSGGDDQATATQVRSLHPTERVNEIARMLGGIEITDTTREHAAEMIDRAARPETA